MEFSIYVLTRKEFPLYIFPKLIIIINKRIKIYLYV